MGLTQVSSEGIKDGEIKNADIKSDAAIALSKLASTPAVLTGSTDNTITTVTAANSIQGEAKLTFDGDTLKFTHDAVTGFDSNSQDFLVIENGDSDTYINIASETNRDSGLIFSDDTRARGWYGYNHSGDFAYIGTAGSERFRIASDGNVTIGNDGDSGSNPSAGYDELCIEGGNENIGMCFLSPSANNVEQTISFGDSNNNQSGKIQYEHANDAMHFDTGGSERLRIDSGGNVKIAASGADAVRSLRIDGTNGSSEIQGFILENDGGNGRLNLKYGTGGGTPSTKVSMLAGGGLTFNGDTAAANSLHDYEEGSWTPTVYGASAAGSTSYSQQVGWYTKIGRLVTITGNVYNTTTGASGTHRIGGVPFACVGEATGTFQCNDMENSYQSNVGQYTAMIQDTEQNVHFRGTKTNGSGFDYMQVQNMQYLRFTITYESAT